MTGAHLQVELHHGQGGARSGAGYEPSESSGARVSTVTAVLYRFMRRITRYHLAVTVPLGGERRVCGCQSRVGGHGSRVGRTDGGSQSRWAGNLSSPITVPFITETRSV